MILVSAGDAIGAKLVKEAEFDGIWISGFEACARLGLADNGTITLAQMLNIAKPIVSACDLPVFVDVDTGYDDFIHTVYMFEDIGVAGVCIEDVEPAYKQNSLWGDRVPLMEIKDFIKKINIPNRKIKIIARTEALIRKYGYKEAIERACCYFSAGADYILIHTRDETGKEIKEISKHSYLPLSIAPTKCPYYTNKELYEMGYSMIIWANQTERTKIRAVRDMLYQLKQNDRMLEAEEHLCATLEDMKGLMP